MYIILRRKFCVFFNYSIQSTRFSLTFPLSVMTGKEHMFLVYVFVFLFAYSTTQFQGSRRYFCTYFIYVLRLEEECSTPKHKGNKFWFYVLKNFGNTVAFVTYHHSRNSFHVIYEEPPSASGARGGSVG